MKNKSSDVSAENFSVLSFKPGHDGCVAHVKSGNLKFSIEAEKDNGWRFAELNLDVLGKISRLCQESPSVVALSGWSRGDSPNGQPIGAGYCGVGEPIFGNERIFGKSVELFQSTHERSHIFCSYGMSPFPQGQECYLLTWEGHIGAFYHINSDLRIAKLADVLSDPGIRYAFLYALADERFPYPNTPGAISLNHAGKLMAIAAYANKEPLSQEGTDLIDRIVSHENSGYDLIKNDFRNSAYYDSGIDNLSFANLARSVSDRIFETFHNKINSLIDRKIPLLISGGCGLNCDWNTQWRESGLFEDVFIPPCTNDTGSAIGTAIEAQYYYTGNAKINWNVYCGEEAEDDGHPCPEFFCTPLDCVAAAAFLYAGNIIGWIRGRYEIGPRALGARSILASPQNPDMLRRLNKIKQREHFRPIAPICLESDMATHFEPSFPSPFMLEFRKVKTSTIPAVTHVDGSARPQSIRVDQNKEIYDLLLAFKNISGIGVLCNTSLNFSGKGFINKLSDLYEFAIKHDLDGFVFMDKFYIRNYRI